MNILIICGHGKGDPGCTSVINGYTRKEELETRVLGSQLYKLLPKNGFTTYLYPTNRNAFVDTQTNSFRKNVPDKIDYALEIHFNAADAARGTEGFTVSRETQIEKDIISNVAKEIGTNNRGLKHKNFNVIYQLSEMGIPAMLLEVCFLTSESDMKNYDSLAVADAIISAFEKNFGGDTVSYDEFKTMMDKYLSERSAKSPGAWSAEAREYVENKGIMNDGQYQSFVTREQLAEVLYRFGEL